MAKWFMIAGAVLLLVGALIHYAPWTVSWFGKLPGDVDIKNDQGRIFIPITSMIVISIALSLLINLFRK